MKEKKGGTKVRRSKIGDDVGPVWGAEKLAGARAWINLTIVPLCGNTCTVDDINEINFVHLPYTFYKVESSWKLIFMWIYEFVS